MGDGCKKAVYRKDSDKADETGQKKQSYAMKFFWRI
tara:strand:- start:5 stop:112 length:108 start_codon:yes stop_codon:yes gene_type:complete